MGLAGDELENVYIKFSDVCNDLNLDKDATNEAWQSYEKVREKYSLEGDQLQWLGCALYVACRKATPSTVGKSETLIEGNLVSLSRLLRLCKLSFIQFINKFKKWADMTSLSHDFRTKLDRLVRNFAVSTTIFKKFQPIFEEMFIASENPKQGQQKSKKQRHAPCSLTKVFDFTWTLFVCVKAEVPDISDDLVSSYHLLLACCDLIFFNAVLSDRRDLLNANFAGLPKNFFDKDYSIPVEPQCIIYDLCQNHDGISKEAKSIKEYCWKSQIRKLFDKKILKGNSTSFSDLLETTNFEQNLKNVNKMYEEYVLSVGDFDERIFLEEDSSNDIGTPGKIIGQSGIGDFTESLQAKRNMQAQLGSMQPLTPATPLTGRNYLKCREGNNVTPVSTATQSVSRLQNMLSGRQTYPSTNLQNIISKCADNPHIEERVKEMGALFCAKYTKTTDDYGNSDSHTDFAKKRLQLAICLYYKLLDNILTEEIKRPHYDFNSLLNQDIFHQTIFACCLEIVIYSYNSQRTFPWVLEALSIEPYHFYKVIEIIVRAEDQLSRDMVKHLNMIEEQILESLAWRNESPLWASLSQSNLPIPSCEDVSLPGQLQEHSAQDSNNSSTVLNTAAIRKITTFTGASTPVASVSERFQSPVTMTGLGKKPWRFMETSGRGGIIRTVKPGQSLLQNQQGPTQSQPVTTGGPKLMTMNIQAAIETDEGKRYIPIAINPASGNVIIHAHRATSTPITTTPTTTTESTPIFLASQPQPTTESSDGTVTVKDNKINNKKAKRTGSIALFFRKFYHLASVRMQELCNQLNLMDVDLRRKIWTCFEHSIVEHIHLMVDRHLDQIIMCAVYVICKIVGPERTFTEVMRCYRLQPQCSSHVYRNVLLRSSRNKINIYTGVLNNTDNNNTTEEATPGNQAQLNNSSDTEERGDLIRFYNTVYVMNVQTFVMRFNSRGLQNDKLTLSPLPVGKSTPMSPRRRISEKHSIYIRPLTSSEPHSFPPSPCPIRSLGYCFSRSPAKDLRAINTMIQVECGRKIGKRLLTEDGEGEPAAKRPPCHVVNRKMADIYVDRLTAKTIQNN